MKIHEDYHQFAQNQTDFEVRYDDHQVSQNVWLAGDKFYLTPSEGAYRLGYIQRATLMSPHGDVWSYNAPCSVCPHCGFAESAHRLKLLTTSIDGNIYFGACTDSNHYWLVFQPDGDMGYMKRSQVVLSFDPFLRNCKTFPAMDSQYESVAKYFSDEQLEASRPTNFFDFVKNKDWGWTCKPNMEDFAKEVVV